MALSCAFVTAATPSPAAETVAVTVAPLPDNPPQANAAGMIIRGCLNVTAGTSATAVVIRCRAGGLAGALIGNALTHTLAAGATDDIPFGFEDANFADPGAGYVITVAQTGASAAGAVNQAEAELDIALA